MRSLTHSLHARVLDRLDTATWHVARNILLQYDLERTTNIDRLATFHHKFHRKVKNHGKERAKHDCGLKEQLISTG